MNDEEIVAAKAKIEATKAELEAQAEGHSGRLKRGIEIANISEVLPSPKGILKKRCPQCGKGLKKETFSGIRRRMLDYYICECGYEYGKYY